MNKKEYLAKLRMYLQGLPISEIEDIISDYEEHFNIGISKGKSEEEISMELGDPKEVALNYINSSDNNSKTSHENINNNKDKWKWIGLAAVIVTLMLTISFIFNKNNHKSSSDLLNISSNGETVRIGANGIEIKSNDSHVVIGWNGIKIKDGGDEVNMGWDGINIKDDKGNSAFKFSIFDFLKINNKNLKWHEADEEKFAKIDNAKNIFISSPFVDVKVYSEDRNDVRVYYHGKMKTNIIPELVVENEGENLNIELKIEKYNYSVTYSNSVLEIFIPDTFVGNINVSTSSGDALVKDTTCENFSLTSSSGDIFLENIHGKEINLHTSSGDINIYTLVGNMDISTSSGNIKVNSLDGNINMKTSSGDVSLNNITSKEVKIITSSGDIDIALDENANFKITGSTSSGDFIVNRKMEIVENKRGRFVATIGNGIYSMEIRTSSGDVTFK